MMSDRDSGEDHSNQRRRRDSDAEEELATKTVQMQNKRFYMDVKQNRRGRFVKIAEIGIGATGRKSRLLFPMSTASEFCDRLSEFSDYHATLADVSEPDKIPEDGKLKSEVIVKDSRRYYLDLKENQRGRFLRVSQVVPRSGQRSQVAIPAEGMAPLRDTLKELLDEFGTDDHETQSELPDAESLRVENKMFYFDVGSNNRGVYMRISEVRANLRTAITIPESSWTRFRDTLNNFIDKNPSQAAKREDSASGGGASASGGGGGSGAGSSAKPPKA